MKNQQVSQPEIFLSLLNAVLLLPVGSELDQNMWGWRQEYGNLEWRCCDVNVTSITEPDHRPGWVSAPSSYCELFSVDCQQ